MDNRKGSSNLALIEKIKSCTSQELIYDKDWETISSSSTLLYELLKKGTFNEFDSLPSFIFKDHIAALLLMNYQHPPVHKISLDLFKNSFFLCQVLENNYSHIQYIPNEFLNEDLLIWYCKLHGQHSNIFSFLSKELITKECAKILAYKNYLNYSKLSTEFKNDIDVYNSVLKIHRTKVFKAAGKNIKSNPYLVVSVLEDDCSLYKYIDDSLKTSEFFLRHLKDVPNLLEHANEKIRNNEHCVWESVKILPSSLYYASERLLNTPSFALQLTKDMNISAFTHSFDAWGETVTSHKDTIMELIPQLCESQLVPSISESLRADKDVMLKIIEKDSYWFKVIAPPLCCDPYFLKSCYDMIIEQDRYSAAKHKRAYGLFENIQEVCFEEASYLLYLYDHFRNIFYDVIYPAISHFSTEIIRELKEAHELGNDNLDSFIEKIRLRYSLETQLTVHNKLQDVVKI